MSCSPSAGRVRPRCRRRAHAILPNCWLGSLAVFLLLVGLAALRVADLTWPLAPFYLAATLLVTHVWSRAAARMRARR